MGSLSRSFIGRWIGALGQAILHPKRINTPYRLPTPANHRSGGGNWRWINGSASWTGKKAAKRHRQWAKRIRKDSATLSAARADLQSRGLTVGPLPSQRTTHRAFARQSAKHLGV